MPNRVNEAFDMIAAAEKSMDTEAYSVVPPIDIDNEDPHAHQHIAIAWKGSVIWLDMSEQHDHFCVDVRQFVPDPVRKDQSKTTREDGTLIYTADGSEVMPGSTGVRPDHGVELAGQGVFTIVNGRQQTLASKRLDGGIANTEPLKDPDGTPVRGHGWNAGYVVTLMHDKVPSDKQTNRPAGPGRG